MDDDRIFSIRCLNDEILLRLHEHSKGSCQRDTHELCRASEASLARCLLGTSKCCLCEFEEVCRSLTPYGPSFMGLSPDQRQERNLLCDRLSNGCASLCTLRNSSWSIRGSDASYTVESSTRWSIREFAAIARAIVVYGTLVRCSISTIGSSLVAQNATTWHLE